MISRELQIATLSACRSVTIGKRRRYGVSGGGVGQLSQPSQLCAVGPKAHGNRRTGDNFAFEIPTKIPRCCHQLSCLVCKCRGFGLLFTPERTLLGRIGQGQKKWPKHPGKMRKLWSRSLGPMALANKMPDKSRQRWKSAQSGV